MTVNPTAIVAMAVCSTIGYLAGGTEGAMIGFAIMGSISVLASIIQ